MNLLSREGKKKQNRVKINRDYFSIIKNINQNWISSCKNLHSNILFHLENSTFLNDQQLSLRVYEITINENCKKTFEKVIVDCNLLIFESDSTIRYDMEERACGHFFLSRLFYFYGDPRMLKGMHYTRMTQFRDTVFLAG